jgi:methyl-accepting chemotaxis protein
MFQKSTITTRLLAGFGVVIAMLVAVSAVGMVNLNSLTGQMELLGANRMPLVTAAGKWEASVLRSARHMQMVFLLTEQGEVEGELKALRANREEQAQLEAQIKQLATTDEARALLAPLEAARRNWVQNEAEMMKFLQEGRSDEAKIALLTRARQAQADYLAALSKLSSFFTTEAREMVKRSASSYQTMLTAFVLAMLFCVTAAVAVAVIISRSIRGQLGGEPEYARAVVNQVAGGDLTVDVKLDRADHDSLLFAMREMVASLRAMVGETARSAQAVADTSSQIAQGNLDLSQRTEEQASTLEEAASSMEELTATVSNNAQHAKQASELAASAAETARQGGQVVDEVVSTMDQILDASKKIQDIIGVIDGIAFQTNILALNAAVEAARAGEQGRGFAVVATEVRNLAHRSAAAAKEIKGLISESQDKVSAGSAKVDEAGHTMVGVVLSVQKVNKLIADIASASQDQSAKIRQVSGAVKQMDTVVQQNASLVEEAAAATESMKDQAGTLLDLMARFRVDQDGVAYAAATATSPAALEAPGPIRVRARADLPPPQRPQIAGGDSGAGGWKEY